MTIDLRGLTPELLARYDQPGPRYTSYPTAPHFAPDFDQAAYRDRLRIAAARDSEPLAMYVHLPFCEERCTFCGCNVVISPRRGPEVIQVRQIERRRRLALSVSLCRIVSALTRRERQRCYPERGGEGVPSNMKPVHLCFHPFRPVVARLLMK